MKRLLARMLDEAEFLSALRRALASRATTWRTPSCSGDTETEFTVSYEPAESQTDLFGGNSNWRGPVWMPDQLPDY